MPHPPSLTLRLTLLFGVAAVIVFSGFGWFIERSIDKHFSEEDSEELEVITHAVSQILTSQDVNPDTKDLHQRFSDILVGHHAATLYVANLGGHIFFASQGGPDLSPITATISSNKHGLVRRWSDGEHTYRVLTRILDSNESINENAYTIAVAVAIDYHQRFINGFRLTLWSMIASGIGVMGVMGWIAVRQGHVPLHNIVAQIRQISANELNTRLPPEMVPRELTDLAVSFNEMLERMEEAFQRLSNFSSDIAHELRTPVTNLLTQTQVALSQTRTVEEYSEILYSNIEEYERMAQMIGDMLFLAKAENGMFELDKVEIDLSKEVQELFEYYEAWAEECDVSLKVQGCAKIFVDRLMFRRAIGNLLSNAIRHTPSNSAVIVSLDKSSNGTVSISVKNPGSPISPEHLTRLFDRFYRVDTSKRHVGDGAGLGLAITKSIIDIHGGKIATDSTEAYTQFKITIPDMPKSAN